MIRIYVARHGETIWNAEGKIQGRSDPELSRKGHIQSLALFERLRDRPLSAIYTSTLRRSIQTAEPIARHLGLSIEKRPELDEIAFGIFEGKQFSDVTGELREEWERFKQDRLTYHIPGGAENYTDVAKRLRPFRERILQDHQGQEILIVAHRGANRMLVGMLLEFSLQKCLEIEQTNDTLYLIERNGKSRVSYYLDGEIKEGLLLVGERSFV